jgi:hypothetical protein
LTVQSQYNKCSAGKLIFEPAPVGDGVIDVHLPGSVIADFVSTAALSNAAQLAAAELLNLPPDQHISSLSDHVMICLPPGTDGNNWVAAAAMNHWRSVYNNKFCGVISASMHELGWVDLPRGKSAASDLILLISYLSRVSVGTIWVFPTQTKMEIILTIPLTWVQVTTKRGIRKNASTGRTTISLDGLLTGLWIWTTLID